MPSTVKLPSMITFSLMLIVVESDESNVVPLILIPPTTTSPVPLGCIERSAFEPLDEIEFVVTAPIVAEPLSVSPDDVN